MPDIGDIKSSLLSINHNGWYNLNGQQIDENTRPYAAQNASTIFGGTFLPDLSDTVLSQQSLKTISGSNSVNVLIDNLPNLSLSGSTSPFSDVLNTDLNGSGIQPLIGGTTESYSTSIISSNAGAVNTSLTGTTNGYFAVATSGVSGAINSTYTGTTSPYTAVVTSTTQGVTVASGTTNATGSHSHQQNVSQANDLNWNSITDNYTVGTDDSATPAASFNYTLPAGDHSHTVNVNVPAHSHDVSISIPSLTTSTLVTRNGHTHLVDVNVPPHGTTTPLVLPDHSHDVNISMPALNVTGTVNIPNHSHAFDLEIPTLSVSVPLNGLQQPLDIKGKRFGVNFFIYLGIG